MYFGNWLNRPIIITVIKSIPSPIMLGQGQRVAHEYAQY
jgi:hypothetical protein